MRSRSVCAYKSKGDPTVGRYTHTEVAHCANTRATHSHYYDWRLLPFFTSPKLFGHCISHFIFFNAFLPTHRFWLLFGIWFGVNRWIEFHSTEVTFSTFQKYFRNIIKMTSVREWDFSQHFSSSSSSAFVVVLRWRRERERVISFVDGRLAVNFMTERLLHRIDGWKTIFFSCRLECVFRSLDEW